MKKLTPKSRKALLKEIQENNHIAPLIPIQDYRPGKRRKHPKPSKRRF